jgi:uncharacterized repeat protein (TIGR01451 family)
MKLSTFGIGIALFCIIGGAARILSEGTSIPFSAQDEQSVVFAGEVVSAKKAEATQSTESKYLFRGQLSPGKLTRRDTPTSASNPLRANVDPPSVQPKPLTPQQSPARELPLPPTKFQPITQTAMQTDSNGFSGLPDTSSVTVASPSSAAQPELLESAGFGADLGTVQPDPTLPLGEPKRLHQNLTFEPSEQPTTISTAEPSNPLQNQTPNQLSNADPFTNEGRLAAVPPLSVSSPPFAPSQPVTDFSNGGSPPTTPPKSFIASSVPSPNPAETEGTGLPGAAFLEGVQTPHITIEKSFPAEIRVNEPTAIKLTLRNIGRSPAKNIVVRDRVPQGARLLATSPDASPSENGELFWSLGHLDANEQANIEIRLLPFREGEIGSVAVVNYDAEASARITVTKPMLKVEIKAPQEIQLGGVANIEILISNPGSATATGIILEEYVPDGLYHKDGKVLVNKNVDFLKPKDTKKLTLQLTCTGSGNLVNRLVVKANGNLTVEEKTTIRALAPILKLDIEGSTQQFLERKAMYRLIIENQGTSSAQNVDLVVTLPAAVKFVSTNQSGIYEPQTHSVHWTLEELPAAEKGVIELVLMPSQTGDHTIRFKGIGQNNLKAEESKPVMIDGLPAISFEVVGDSNLVEVGKETTYEIRVINRGTKAAGNVKVRANLSEGMTYSKADGPVRHQSNGNIVAFEPLTQLEAKGEKIYKIAAKSLADGDHRISVQVVSDDLSSPITKEESTRVFK